MVAAPPASFRGPKPASPNCPTAHSGSSVKAAGRRLPMRVALCFGDITGRGFLDAAQPGDARPIRGGRAAAARSSRGDRAVQARPRGSRHHAHRHADAPQAGRPSGDARPPLRRCDGRLAESLVPRFRRRAQARQRAGVRAVGSAGRRAPQRSAVPQRRTRTGGPKRWRAWRSCSALSSPGT